jgi:site-specific recombinase XerD
MNCIKCNLEIDSDSVFCKFCGKKQIREPVNRQRGNGQGSILRRGNKWIAYAPVIYYKDDQGKLRKKTRSKTCATKKEAAAALAEMIAKPDVKKKKTITFKALYDKWLPTHEAGKSTMDCYKAAMKYFQPVWFMRMDDIDVDDLQDCLDNCGKGKRTQQNMKAVCGLVYKYGIPRQSVPENLNLAQFLKVGGEDAVHRESFDSAQIDAIKKQIGITPKAEYVYCLIYLGFRPSEFLALNIENYDSARQCFTGGGKTEAGSNRTVTISPKIQPYINKIAADRTEGAFFCTDSGKAYSLQDFTEKVFYPVLTAAGIDNPMVEISGGIERHKYTPHSCRHTFATLLKNVQASDKDKLELIGHTSDEMLRYYQDVKVEDLRKITDNL